MEYVNIDNNMFMLNHDFQAHTGVYNKTYIYKF
jgi:hypothetical protein